ncbi:MAG: hypothetical protein ABIB43_06625 [archaeon]
MTNLPLNRITQIREEIVNFTGQYSKEELKKQTLESLLNHLSETTGKKVSSKDLNKVMHQDYHRKQDWNESWIKDMPVSFIDLYVKRENKSLERIEKLSGKKAYDMSANELKDMTMEMLTMTNKQYDELIKQNGVKKDKGMKFNSFEDVSTLLGLLETKNVKFSREDMRQIILDKEDFGLGYFNNLFKTKFNYFSRDDGFGFDEGEMGLYSAYHREFSRLAESLEKHLKAEKSLKARHTMAPPKLLNDKTINLGIRPYTIDFTLDGNLAVLGGQLDQKEDDFDSARMLLNVYDINTQKLLNSIDTKIISRFDGAGPFVNSFHGNLTVGSDGIFYVNGGRKRFSPELELLVDNESKFQDAFSLVMSEEFIREGYRSYEAFQVVENDGIFYFALQPSSHPYCYNNHIVATDGKKRIGVPILGYSPTGGSSVSNEDDNPRIIVKDNELFFKVHKTIMSVDKSMTEKALENSFLMFKGGRGINNPMPSNHCVSENGILYLVTQLEEEATQSIQGYTRGKEKGEFATHVYPEDCPGGWAAFRSMAISKDNLLAYTSQNKNKVHLYELAK